ncbi:MAG: nucleotidyltransferase family protein [Bacteroidetes bacterium]|nr:nucleotidyltransferase family protein [Bacteroidota bacterium]
MNFEENKLNYRVFEVVSSYLKKHGAKKISVFGSYIKGKQNDESDLDLLVEFSERKSLLELIRIERELSDKLNLKVDLLTEKSISPYIFQSIKDELVVIG